MKVKFINTLESARKYVKAVENGNTDFKKLWDEYLIQPYWKEISQWAPFDCLFMKPAPIKDIDKLKKQLDIFQDINFEHLEREFKKISNALLKQDDDPIVIAFYPLDDENLMVKDFQNGIVGVCVFGNIVININPLAKDYEKWIPYVMAHEYHHSVWRHNWYVLRGNAKGNLLETLINEGQADAFAKSLYNSLEPKWLNTLTSEQESLFWEKYTKVLNSTDRSENTKYIFGDQSKGLPRCIGYHFGYEIVESYLKNNPEKSFNDVIDIDSDVIFKDSRFYKSEVSV